MANGFQGPPAADFYSQLSGLGDVIAANRTAQAKRDAFAQATMPGPDGQIDFGKAVLGLAQVDPQAAALLAQRQNHQDTLKQQAEAATRQVARDKVTDSHWSSDYALRKAAGERAGEDKYAIKEVTNADGTTGLVRIKATGDEGPISGTTSTPAPRKMSISDISKLSEEGQKFSTLSSVADKFEDRFAGYLPGTGGASMTAGRYLPEGLVGKDRAEGAAYWQEYDRYKNVVRNELFGSALTAGETKAFAQADIDPSMQPAQIKKNLARQKELVQTAIKRKAQAAITSGYDQKAIGQAYGIDMAGPAPASGVVDWRTYFGGK